MTNRRKRNRGAEAASQPRIVSEHSPGKDKCPPRFVHGVHQAQGAQPIGTRYEEEEHVHLAEGCETTQPFSEGIIGASVQEANALLCESVQHNKLTPTNQNLSNDYDYHGEICEVCHVGGEVVFCGTCSHTFHLECVLAEPEKCSNGQWRCAFCVAQESDIGVELKTVRSMSRRSQSILKKRKAVLSSSSEESDSDDKMQLLTGLHTHNSLSATRTCTNFVHEGSMLSRYGSLEEALATIHEQDLSCDEGTETNDGQWCKYCVDHPSSLASAFCGCKKCFGQHDTTDPLLCDGCERSYCSCCLDPPLAYTPDGNWFCTSCEQSDNVSHADDRVDDKEDEIVTAPETELPALSLDSNDLSGSVSMDSGNELTSIQSCSSDITISGEISATANVNIAFNLDLQSLEALAARSRLSDVDEPANAIPSDGCELAIDNEENFGVQMECEMNNLLKPKNCEEQMKTELPESRQGAFYNHDIEDATDTPQTIEDMQEHEIAAVEETDNESTSPLILTPANKRMMSKDQPFSSISYKNEQPMKRARFLADEDSDDVTYDLTSVLHLISQMNSRLLELDELGQLDSVRNSAISDHLYSLLDALHHQKHLLLTQLKSRNTKSNSEELETAPIILPEKLTSFSHLPRSQPRLSSTLDRPNMPSEQLLNGMRVGYGLRDSAANLSLNDCASDVSSRRPLQSSGASDFVGKSLKSFNGRGLGNVKLAKAAAILKKAESIAKANGTLNCGRLSKACGDPNHCGNGLPSSAQHLPASTLESQALSTCLEGLSQHQLFLDAATYTEISSNLLQLISQFNSQMLGSKPIDVGNVSGSYSKEQMKPDQPLAHGPQNVAEALAFLGTASSVSLPSTPPGCGGMNTDAGPMMQLLGGDAATTRATSVTNLDIFLRGQKQSQQSLQCHDVFKGKRPFSQPSSLPLEQSKGLVNSEATVQPAYTSSLGMVSLMDYVLLGSKAFNPSSTGVLGVNTNTVSNSLGDFSGMNQMVQELHNNRTQNRKCNTGAVFHADPRTQPQIRLQPQVPSVVSAAAAAQLAMLSAALGAPSQSWHLPDIVAAIASQHWTNTRIQARSSTDTLSSVAGFEMGSDDKRSLLLDVMKT